MTADAMLAVDVLRAALTWVLPYGRCREAPPIGPQVLSAVALRHRVTGLAVAAAEAGAFENWASDPTPDIRESHEIALRQSLDAEAHSVRVTRRLSELGLENAVLKGLATAHLDYPSPSLRVTGDVDVLVRRNDIETVVSELGRDGYLRTLPPFSASWERRFSSSVTLAAPAGPEIDLHISLIQGELGRRLDADSLLRRGSGFELAGRTIPALDIFGRLVHACAHSAKGLVPAMPSCCDIVRIASELSGDVSGFVAYVEEIQCEPLVAAGVVRTWELFDLRDSALSDWARSVRGDAGIVRLLEALASPHGEVVLASSIRSTKLRDLPAFIVPLVIPSKDHLQARGRTRIGHVLHSIRSMRSRKARS